MPERVDVVDPAVQRLTDSVRLNLPANLHPQRGALSGRRSACTSRIRSPKYELTTRSDRAECYFLPDWGVRCRGVRVCFGFVD